VLVTHTGSQLREFNELENLALSADLFQRLIKHVTLFKCFLS